MTSPTKTQWANEIPAPERGVYAASPDDVGGVSEWLPVSPVRTVKRPKGRAPGHGVYAASPDDVGRVSEWLAVSPVRTVKRPKGRAPGGWAGGGRAAGGFSLIEMLGVLAIIALLAAMLIPTLIKRIDRAAWTREVSDLNETSNALTLQILRNKSIPNETTWATAVADWLSVPVSKITTTPRQLDRVFLIDPSGWLNTALPFTQTTNGITAPPTSSRMMVLSTIARPLTSVITSGKPPAATFNDIWDAAQGTKPSTLATWPGKGEDLLIQRVNLEPLFHRVILLNHDPHFVGRFSIDGNPANGMPLQTNSVGGFSRYYLDGSIIGLHDTNGVVQTRYLLKRDISFVFDYGNWRGQLIGGLDNSNTGDAFAEEAAQFLAAQWNPQSHQGASQFSVLVSMYTFMFDYILWSTECPHFFRHGNTGSSLSSTPEYEIIDAVGADNGFLDQYSDDTTGLLKPK